MRSRGGRIGLIAQAAALAGAALASAAFIGEAAAREPELSGFAAIEVRIFPSDPQFPQQETAVVQPSLALQPEVRWDIDEDQRITFIPFARLDSADTERTHADLRELNYLYDGGEWDVRVGFAKVFWGVAESRHLVDIINQTDLIESADEEDKLGQPMVNANVLTEIGTFSGFVMPFFRERTYPGIEGRPGFPIPVREDDAVFESPDGESHVDWAARWQMRVGAFDIGLAHFSGTGREPRLVTTVVPGTGPALVPHYDLIEQSSIDAQATLDAWLLKLEAIARSGQGDSFAAVTTGFEYTLYQVFESSADLGLISEYHYDGRDDTAPFTLFDNDLMVGARLAFNDIDDSSVLLGAINDLETGTTVMTLEAATRIADGFKLEIEARAFPYVANGATESAFGRDHMLEIRLQRFF